MDFGSIATILKDIVLSYNNIMSWGLIKICNKIIKLNCVSLE